LKGVYNLNFQKPSMIQQHSIPLIMNRTENILAQARSGTGKTASFALGSLSKVDPADPSLQVICLGHTRELTIQNFETFYNLAKFTEIKVALAIPDPPASIPNVENTNPAHIIVGTPGTVDYLLTRKKIDPSKLKMIILDEADEFVAAGNLATQAGKVTRKLPKTVRMLCFSATFEPGTEKFINNVCKEPRISLRLAIGDVVVQSITQLCVVCETDEEKLQSISWIHDSMMVGNSIVFCQRITEADKVVQLLKNTYAETVVAGLHGKKENSERDKLMEDFRNTKIRHLVTTNVLARGLDVPEVSVVVNYNLPEHKRPGYIDFSCYIHRIGRTGRFHKKGLAVSLVSKNEIPMVEKIQSHFHCNIKRMTYAQIATDLQPYLIELGLVEEEKE